MKGKMNAKMGNIIIDRDVLAKYAGAATQNVLVSWAWRPLM